MIVDETRQSFLPFISALLGSHRAVYQLLFFSFSFPQMPPAKQKYSCAPDGKFLIADV
jgi:hypothetical protein